MTESAFVRAARAGDAAVLSEIAWASKRHWGYSDEWMDKWRAALVISPAYLERNPVFVAEVCSTIAAFCAVVRTEVGWDLDHLWVRPEFIGQGIGSELFRHTVTFIQAQGQPTVLTIEAEPNAEGFYTRLGAVRVSTIVREWEGLRRELPYLEYQVVAA